MQRTLSQSVVCTFRLRRSLDVCVTMLVGSRFSPKVINNRLIIIIIIIIIILIIIKQQS